MDVEKFLGRADQALRKRNPVQASALYRQVLIAKPGHAAAWAGLLASWRRKAELKGGPSLLDKAAARAASALGAGLRAGRKWAAAVKAAEAGLERHPVDGGLAALLAEGLEGLGHQGASLQVWKHRLSLDSADVEALKSAGRLHYALREIDQAMQCLDHAHSIDPRDPEVEKLRKNLAAEGTLRATRYETARSSREVMKTGEAARGTAREVRARPGPNEKAADLEALEERCRTGDSAADRRTLLAALIEAGSLERALQVAREALGQRPGDAGLRVQLARALYRDGQTDRAVEQFQAVAGDAGHDLDVRQGLGACFLAKGLLPLAERQFRAALEVAGGLGTDRGKEICYHLGLVCERQGDLKGALDRYLQIYEVDIQYKDVARKIETLKP